MGVYFFPGASGPVINVRTDYGAKGDGITDDTTAIQNAFNAAFGPAGAPNGVTGRFNNKNVYFPAGHYITSAPLVITRVIGSAIFGDGSNSTLIDFGGTFASNPTAVLSINGMAFSTISRLAFNGPSDPATHHTVCINLHADGALGGTAGNSNVFYDILTSGTSGGILLGFPDGQSISENIFINWTGSGHEYAGYKSLGNNTLNHNFFGGGPSDGGIGYWIAAGSIGVISPLATSNNTVDIKVGSALPLSVVGGRTESLAFLEVGGNPMVHCSGLQQNSTSGTTFVNFTGSGTVILDGCRSDAAVGTITSVSTTPILYLRGCTFANSSVLAGFSGTQNVS